MGEHLQRPGQSQDGGRAGRRAEANNSKSVPQTMGFLFPKPVYSVLFRPEGPTPPGLSSPPMEGPQRGLGPWRTLRWAAHAPGPSWPRPACGLDTVRRSEVRRL